MPRLSMSLPVTLFPLLEHILLVLFVAWKILNLRPWDIARLNDEITTYTGNSQ
jgi:hypothetical protein